MLSSPLTQWIFIEESFIQFTLRLFYSYLFHIKTFLKTIQTKPRVSFWICSSVCRTSHPGNLPLIFVNASVVRCFAMSPKYMPRRLISDAVYVTKSVKMSTMKAMVSTHASLMVNFKRNSIISGSTRYIQMVVKSFWLMLI